MVLDNGLSSCSVPRHYFMLFCGGWGGGVLGGGGVWVVGCGWGGGGGGGCVGVGVCVCVWGGGGGGVRIPAAKHSLAGLSQE